jgi:drug/metabolite transporter (DMT)-like permease
VRGRILIVYALCCAVWGSTWAVIKVGLVDVPPLRFAGIRMLLACALVTPLLWQYRKRWPSRDEWKHIALVGGAQIGISYGCIFIGEQHLSSGLTAVLFATFPVWTGLLAHFALPDEPLTPLRMGAALLAVGGAIVVEVPTLGSLQALASPAALLPLVAAISSAFGNVWLKKRIGHLPGAVSLWGQTLVGGSMLLLASLGWERDAVLTWTPRAMAALSYLTIFGTVATFLALFWLIPRVSMVAIGVIPIVDTLFAVCLGVGLLGEPLTPLIAVGAALILGAAVLANAGSWIRRRPVGAAG